MSATNQTPTLHLPIFVEDDKPSWMGDFNGAMNKLDNGHTELASDVATDKATILALQTAVADLTARVTALESA